MRRRTFVAGAGVGGLAALSGCLGLIGMDEHASRPAGVDADVRDETGYERTGVDDVVVEEEVGPDALSEEVVVVNHLTEHEKSVDMGPLGDQRGAVFLVLSTPQIGLAGQQFNPVEEMSATELVSLVEDNYDDISNVTLEEESAITILGESTTVARFSTDAEFRGRDLEVDLHVTEAVETDDDLVVTIGVYPQELRSREEENVHALMEGVTPTVETGANDGDGAGDENEGDEEDDSSEDETADDEEDDDGIGLRLPV